MPPVFKSEPRATKTCPTCGTMYEVTIDRVPTQGRIVIECVECGERLDEWDGSITPKYTLISRPAEAGQPA